MTVGNSARMQLNMAKTMTDYSDNTLYGGKTVSANARSKAAQKSLDDLLNSRALKGKSDVFREEFSNLYKSIFGIKDDDDSSSSTSSSQSLKAVSSSAGSATEGMKSFANGLKYGGEIDLDAYKSQAQSFVDNYNAMVDKLANSDNQQVLQKGVLLVNTSKVYSNALNRAGITLGSDNKLKLQDNLSKVSATDVKSTFGSYGFSDKVLQKTQQINQLSGGSGFFVPNVVAGSTGSSSSDKVDNAGTLKELSSAVKEAATSMKSYATGLGDEDKPYVPQDYTDTAKSFVESFNKMLTESGKSNKLTVNQKGESLKSTVSAYKFALNRAGINVGKDGKLSLADNIKDKTEADIKYAFNSSLMDNIAKKAEEINNLTNSNGASSYNANGKYNYAYTSGALYSVYA